MDEQDEKAIAEQVQKITNDVNDVVIDNNKSVHAVGRNIPVVILVLFRRQWKMLMTCWMD